jgi:hypothetical protein
MGIDEGLTGRRPGIRSSDVGCRAGNPKSGPPGHSLSGVRSGIRASGLISERPGNPLSGIQVKGVRRGDGAFVIGHVRATRYRASRSVGYRERPVSPVLGQSGPASPGNPVSGGRWVSKASADPISGVQVSPVSGASGQFGRGDRTFVIGHVRATRYRASR